MKELYVDNYPQFWNFYLFYRAPSLIYPFIFLCLTGSKITKKKIQNKNRRNKKQLNQKLKNIVHKEKQHTIVLKKSFWYRNLFIGCLLVWRQGVNFHAYSAFTERTLHLLLTKHDSVSGTRVQGLRSKGKFCLVLFNYVVDYSFD